jgi:alpha-L-rhamnosidase
MAKIAGILGKMEDQAYYDHLSEKIFHAFNDRFYHEEKGIYGNGGQTSMSLALYLDLVPEDQRDRVIGNLLEEIRNKKYHIDAGVIGTRMMIKALTRLGHSNIMYQIANQPDFPGWGYWVNQGATTLWQTWEGDMSLNHIMFGSIGEWFYAVLGGIRVDPGSPGFGKFILKPEAMDSLEWVDCSFESCLGTITSKWKRLGDRLSWQIEIPVNSSATVYFPLKYGSQITESGRPLTDYAEIGITGKREDHLLLELPSGRYNFETD